MNKSGPVTFAILSGVNGAYPLGHARTRVGRDLSTLRYCLGVGAGAGVVGLGTAVGCVTAGELLAVCGPCPPEL